MNDGM